MTALGTDGFGRSENREHLRRFFEVDAASIAAAALSRLAAWGRFDPARAQQAIQELGLKHGEPRSGPALAKVLSRFPLGNLAAHRCCNPLSDP